jgi:SnoaL-like domain
MAAMNDTEMTAMLEVVQRPEAARTSPDDRLQALEDREEIRGLIMTYGYLCDARRWDDLLALYTDDIERVLAGSLVERVQGKAALREKLVAPTLEHRSGEGSAPPPSSLEQLGLRHLMASDLVRLGDDGVTARAVVQYQMVAVSDDDRGFRRGAHEGSYVFDFRKEADGRWRFSRQFIVSDNAHNPMFQREEA